VSPERRRRKTKGDVETRRIEWLSELHDGGRPGALPIGIGDDAAAWRPREGHEVIVSVDAQAEGTHFRNDWLSPREIGRRAVHASISDLAAMMSRPAAILVSLLLPKDSSEASFRGLVRGIDDAAREFDTPIIGGNTSRGPLSITITVIGEVPRGEAVRRDGLRVGDEIWVTGCPGLAYLGWKCLENGRPKGWSRRDEQIAIASWKKPRARVAEALAIKKAASPRAAIDLSDGLANDLRHMVRASREAGRAVAVELEADALRGLSPLARLCTKIDRGPGVIDVALRGGEDYEICFSVERGGLSRAKVNRLERRFGVGLSKIGRVCRAEVGSRGGETIRVVGSEGARIDPDGLDGFGHFEGT